MAEAERVGRWIDTYGDAPHDSREEHYWWHCSECGYSVTATSKSKYCPCCGARMENKKEYTIQNSGEGVACASFELTDEEYQLVKKIIDTLNADKREMWAPRLEIFGGY